MNNLNYCKLYRKIDIFIAIKCYKIESHKQLSNEQSSTSIAISSEEIPINEQIISGVWQISANETIICSRDPHRIYNLTNKTYKLELEQLPKTVRQLAIDMSNSMNAHVLIVDEHNNHKVKLNLYLSCYNS